MNKRFWIVIGVIAAVFIGILYVSGNKNGTGSTAANATNHVKGKLDSKVTLVEYGDFQCPACGSAYTIINQPLLAKYGSKIRFEFKHFPLRQIHENAYEAAQAAECAADQGKFWEFVDMDYQQQKDLSSTMLRTWGAALGLNVDLFDRCIRSEIKGATIMADEAEGEKLGVSGTPAYFVNGVRVEVNSLEVMVSAIDEALTKAKSAPL